MLKTILIAAAVTFAGSAMADEVVIQRDDPAPATKTVVEHHDDLSGCSSKTVHKEDGMGDSKTVKKSDC